MKLPVRFGDERDVKCPRCWDFHVMIDNFDYLCDRCQLVLLKNFPDHPSVPFIKEGLLEQRKKYASF